MLKDTDCEGGVAFLGDQFGGVVGEEFGEEEEIGGGDGVAQKLDALADERGYGQEFPVTDGDWLARRRAGVVGLAHRRGGRGCARRLARLPWDQRDRRH